MPPYVPLVIKCQFPNQMSNDQFISQTFAQLEEARRKKSLASKRKQNHYQVGIFAPVEQWTVFYCNNNQILGVDQRAPIELIKKAYRAKVVFTRDASSYDC